MEREKWRKDYDIYFSFLFQQNYRRIEYIIDPRLSLFVFTVNFAREIEIDKIFFLSSSLERRGRGKKEEDTGTSSSFSGSVEFRVAPVAIHSVSMCMFICVHRPDRLCPFARGGGGEVIIEKGERDGL